MPANLKAASVKRDIQDRIVKRDRRNVSTQLAYPYLLQIRFIFSEGNGDAFDDFFCDCLLMMYFLRETRSPAKNRFVKNSAVAFVHSANDSLLFLLRLLTFLISLNS